VRIVNCVMYVISFIECEHIIEVYKLSLNVNKIAIIIIIISKLIMNKLILNHKCSKTD